MSGYVLSMGGDELCMKVRTMGLEDEERSEWSGWLDE